MPFLTIPVSIILPILLLCIPYYFFSKWLEKLIIPRQSFGRFAGWFLLVAISAILYFSLVGWVYIHFIQPRFFNK